MARISQTLATLARYLVYSKAKSRVVPDQRHQLEIFTLSERPDRE